MVLADSSLWIDYFRGTPTPQTEKLDSPRGVEPIATGDLILTAVVQGLDGDWEFNQAQRLMTSLVIADSAGQVIAIQGTENFRVQRSLGIIVRKTIRTVIARRCMESGLPLLYGDGDFDPFVEHFGLRSALRGS